MSKIRISFMSLLFLIVFSMEGTGGLPGEFLNFGASARTMGMGRSGTGLCDDVTATYYNPAGLCQIDPQELLFMHSRLFMGTSYNYLAYVYPTERFGSLGLSIVQVRTGEVEDRDEFNKKIGDFGESETATLLSYAKGIGGFLSLGINYKVIYHSISHWSAMGQGMDLSALILPNKPFSVGIMAKNLIKPTLTLCSEKEHYPLILRGGVSYRAFSDKLIFVSDMSWSEYRQGILLSGGLEYRFYRYASLRWGLDKNYTSFGIGFRMPLPMYTINIDYAFQPHHNSGGMIAPTHNLSLTLEFGGFRVKLHPDKGVFSPISEGEENILWIGKEVNTRGGILRWQLIIKDPWGEVVRTHEAWGDLPGRLYWDGRDETGNLVQDGTYYYQLVVTDVNNRSYSSGGKLTTVKTMAPEGRVLFEERWETLGIDTLRLTPDTLHKFEEGEIQEEEEKGEE